MKYLLPVVFILFTGTLGAAQSGAQEGAFAPVPAENVDNLNEFKWIKRPLLVFSDSPLNPDFLRQMALLEEGAAQLAERDVVVIIDTDPDARSALREEMRPRGFALVLIGKDGGVKLRKPLPWNVRELSRGIDKMPMRQEEMKR